MTRRALIFIFLLLVTLIFIYVSSNYENGNRSTGLGHYDSNSPLSLDKLESYDCPYNYNFDLEPDQPRPDFLLIGVAKGGTTSFSNYLPLHPNVQSVNPKEPNYWTWKYRTTKTYQRMFVNINTPLIHEGSDQLLSGEYTTSYILHPLVARRMHSQLPNIKIIVLFRNPIDRAYSHYIMSSRAHIETLSFEDIIYKEMDEVEKLRSKAKICFNDANCDVSECFPTDPLYKHDEDQSTFYMTSESDMKDYYYTSYLYRSIYDDSIERWLKVYPREQFLFLQSEVFYKETETVMQRVSKFLNLPYFNFNQDPTINHTWGGGASNKYENPHDYPPMRNETRELLQKFFEPYNQNLYNIIGEDYQWD